MPNFQKTRTYRFLEILPALMTWLTFVGAAVFSYFTPFVVAVYIILFDLYWVLKAINTAMHLLSSFFKLQTHARYDWHERLEKLGNVESYKAELVSFIAREKVRRVRRDLAHELQRLQKVDFKNRLTDFRQIYHLV